ncbi:hypothetical protein SprV_0100310100 [Sparganum proliferum]
MKKSVDLFAASCDIFSLIINTEKTVVMHQPPPNTAHNACQINVNGTQLQAVDNFSYMGSTHNTKIDDEVVHRISGTSQAFGGLQNTVCNRHSLHLKTKLRMCKTVIRSPLLYRCTKSRRADSATSTSAAFGGY